MKSMDKKNILWLSDGPKLATGFSTQSLHIMNHAAKTFNAHFLAHTHHGLTLQPGAKLLDGTTFDFYLHGAGRNPYCQDIITPKIAETKADIFGVLLDTFMLHGGNNWFNDLDFLTAKSLFYFPSDGGAGMPKGCENILRKVNYPVAMSRFARKQVKDYYGIKADYIPHACDVKKFYPMNEGDKLKLKASRGLADKFVVGVVARNQGRKFLDRTFKTFSLFAQDHKDAVLFLHTDPWDAAASFDMFNIINRYQLNNRVLFSGMRYFNPFSYAQMNEVYNLMDVFLLSTSGEGFGIPIVEAQATGVPQLVTDYTTTHELLVEDGKCGEPIKLAAVKDDFSEMMGKDVHMKEIDYKMNAGTLTGSWDVERGFMDVYDGVDKLKRLYDNRSLLKTYSQIGRKKAENFYSWDVVFPQWTNLWNRMLEGK